MSDQKELFMDGKTYVATQMRIIEMGKIADSLDLDAFLKCVDNADKAIPLVEHEMGRRAAENLRAVRTLAEAAKVMKQAFIETYQSALVGTVVGIGPKTPGQS